MKQVVALDPDSQLNVYVPHGSVSEAVFPWADPLDTTGGLILRSSHFYMETELGLVVDHIFSHEVGHCFGLYHTFHGSDVSETSQCSACWEEPSRDSCDYTGDLCCDTRATPNFGECSNPGGTDTCSSDYWLSTPFANYMSYSQPDCPPWTARDFTDEQVRRMHCWINSSLLSWLKPPDTVEVPTDYSTIQMAIDSALDGDLVWVAPGTYTENIDFKGKSLIVKSSLGPDTTIIQASDSTEEVVSFTTHEGRGTTLSGFTITGGGNAGIYCDSSSPTIQNCIIEGNNSSSAFVAGGVHLSNTSASDSKFGR